MDALPPSQRNLMEERDLRLLSQICWTGCLLGGVATLYFLFGLAGYVHSSLLNLGVAIALVGALGFFLYQFTVQPKGEGWIGWSLWAGIFIILSAEAILGFLPPTSRDELTHHLAIPKLYAKAGRIIEIPMAPYAYYPMLVDMLFTPWVYWGYDFVPKWIHLLFSGLTALLLYSYLARRMNAVYGWLGAFFFLSTPVIFRLGHWGYNDLALAFYTTASLLCMLRWREERGSLNKQGHFAAGVLTPALTKGDVQPPLETPFDGSTLKLAWSTTNSWLALAALSLGFGLATKPNGLVAALLIALLFGLLLVKPPRRSLAAVSREIFCFGALTLLPFLPWLIKNWWQTNNPLYPFFGSVFGARTASGSVGPNAASFAGVSIFDKRELLFGESIWQIIALPLRVFFSGQDDNPQYFDGVLTPMLILFLPWAFKGKWLEEKKFLLNFALLLLLYAVFLVEMRIRYILAVVPLLVSLFTYGVFNTYLSIKRPVVLAIVLLWFAGWHGIYMVKYFSEAEPLAYLRGAVGRIEYLTRALPEYSAFDYINRQTATDAKIYLLFTGRRAYYCERNYFHDGGELPGILLAAIRSAKNAEQIGQSLAEKQITHLMAREELLAAFLSNNLTPDQARQWNEFASRGLRLGFRARGYAVYQVQSLAGFETR